MNCNILCCKDGKVVQVTKDAILNGQSKFWLKLAGLVSLVLL